ncbi:transposase [Pedobacter sp. Du54]|uniref:transposase n=1 Tax=Pedobacter anseongensis TaxID=3133439 RepID=UPI0030A485CF
MSRKVKHSLEFKLTIVNQLLNGSRSLVTISRENGLERRMVFQWLQFYERFGEAGLRPQSTVYSLENKLEAVRYFTNKKVSLRAACLQFNIRSTSVLSNWLRIYGSGGSEGLSAETRGKKCLMKPRISKKAPGKTLTAHEQVLEENKRLRAEVAFLKKLRALIQKEESKKNKKL